MQRRFAIILGGGRSSRMGRDKRGLVLDGRSLLARAVDACAGRDLVVVVAPDLPGDVAGHRVTRVLEDPPFGGPVAGIASGIGVLPPARPADEVLLLACDLPQVAQIVAVLDAVSPVEPVGTSATASMNRTVDPADTPRTPATPAGSTSHTPAGPADAARAPRVSTRSAGEDGVCLVDAENFPQYLAARYRRDALEARLTAVGDPRTLSVRRLMTGLALRRIPAPDISRDVDTPDEAAAAGLD